MTFIAINPATGEELTRRDLISDAEIDTHVARADAAQAPWAERSIAERVEPLRRLGELLRERRDSYAALMTREMGKPITQGRAEVEKCASMCDYFAEYAGAFLDPEEVGTGALRSYWTYRPLGVVLAIMPWNFPFWQVLRCAGPALTAGNAVLLKHAPSVPGCAEALEQVFADAGYAEGLFTNLFIDTDAAARVIDDPRVRAVSLTGSVRAGRSVAARAGAALKKTVLELGGSDPSLVLADADLDAAAASCAQGRLVNTGQSCIAAKRFIVVESVREEFEAKLTERMAAASWGDPMQEETELGPMARLDLREGLHRQVEQSIEAGARLVLGGTIPDRAGAWYPATVLADVGPGMAAYEEELFGPVAAIIGVRDEEEAIRVANDTAYGLGAVVYTQDLERGERIAAERIEAGSCFVNGIVRSDPRLPFGGVKDSGYGRELGPHGIREFTNVKTVWVEKPVGAPREARAAHAEAGRVE